jgi:hypothetical protein
MHTLTNVRAVAIPLHQRLIWPVRRARRGSRGLRIAALRFFTTEEEMRHA